MRGNVAYILYLAILVSTTGGFAPSILDAHSTTTEAPTPNTEDGAQLPTFLGRHNATVTVHAGDTASLDCHVLRVGAKTVLWAKRDGIDYHVLTFGIHTYHNDNSVDSSMVGGGLTTWLHIARAATEDSGNYTCAAGDTINAHVRVHVLDGESSAAMQHSTTTGAASSPSSCFPASLLFIFIILAST